MTKLEAALVEVASLLQEQSIPYMLIGGLAVSIWGEARAADFSLWVEPENLPEVVRWIGSRLHIIPADPLRRFAKTLDRDYLEPLLQSAGQTPRPASGN